jgi:hypothetical protein
MSDQGILPGLECFFLEPAPKQRKPAAPWKPRPGTLARVKIYFQGYLANGRDIYARRKHIAERLGISVRTLARYLAHLAAAGWIETVKRTARTAIRKVFSFVNQRPGTVLSSGPPIEVKPPSTKVLLRKTEPPLPLVVFLSVCKRYARKNTRGKSTSKKENRWDRLREWGKQEVERLKKIPGTVEWKEAQL